MARSLPAGKLQAARRRLRGGGVAAAEERLVVPSQIDASRHGRPVLLPARLIGIPVRAGGQLVDSLYVKAGGNLASSGGPQAVLDWNFAHHFSLPDSGSVRIAGLGTVPYPGVGVTPQYFLIVDEAGISGAESGLAVVYVPLAEAQRAGARLGQVNQLLLRVAGRSPVSVERELRSAFASALPRVGVRMTLGGGRPSRGSSTATRATTRRRTWRSRS